jgi:hypothetical protein
VDPRIEREKFDAMLCALRLSGMKEEQAGEHLQLVKDHVVKGFPVPTEIIDFLTSTVGTNLQSVTVDHTVFCLLQIAVAGLSAKSKKFAYGLITQYQINTCWTTSQLFWAKECLKESSRPARKVS